MQRGLLLILSVALASSPALPQPSQDPFLTLGIRQYTEGDFEAAVFTLDTAVRKLTGQAGRTRELVLAYVHLGATYVNLDHEDAAIGKFREALALDPALRLGRDQFSPRVIKVFETQLLKTTAARQKKGAKKVLIVGGLGAVAAVGVTAATQESGLPPNRAPSATIGVSPEGQALAGVTTLTFTASASDPDSDPLTFSWDFGAGGSASGPTAAHRFMAAGSFAVVLTVSDGRGGSTTAGSTAIVRTLAGAWRIGPGNGGGDVRISQCTQDGATFDCQAPRLERCGGEPPLDPTCDVPPDYCCYIDRWSGVLSDPRNVAAVFETRNLGSITCTGEVSSDLQHSGASPRMANRIQCRASRRCPQPCCSSAPLSGSALGPIRSRHPRTTRTSCRASAR